MLSSEMFVEISAARKAFYVVVGLEEVEIMIIVSRSSSYIRLALGVALGVRRYIASPVYASVAAP